MTPRLSRRLIPFLLLATACAEDRAIASQSYDGPIAIPSRSCFIATNDDGPIWVDPWSGVQVQLTQRAPPIRDMSFDVASSQLLVLHGGELSTVALDGGVLSTLSEMNEVVRIWPTDRGVLTATDAGRWEHARGHLSLETSRWLPAPQSIWATNEHIYWIGASQPRSKGTVVLRSDRASPLATATRIEDARMGRATAVTTLADGTVVAAISDGQSVILETAGAETDGGDGCCVTGLVGLTANDVVLAVATEMDNEGARLGEAALEEAALEEAALEETAHEEVRYIDLSTGQMVVRHDLKGPLAGPTPCPFPDTKVTP